MPKYADVGDVCYRMSIESEEALAELVAAGGVGVALQLVALVCLKLLVYEALSYWCMRPSATSV
jgi:hypothetical protein